MAIKMKCSAVAAKVPGVDDLALGELAVNTNDGKLYLKKDDGTEAIVEIGPVRSVAGKTGIVTLEQADVSGLAAALSGKQATSAKGQANGFAGLDGEGRVPEAQLPVLGVASGYQVFLTSGTWTKPDGVTSVAFLTVNGGFGGYGGDLNADAIKAPGGMAGGHFFRIVTADELSATETVVVGAGGLGGPAQTVDLGGPTEPGEGGVSSFAGFSSLFGMLSFFQIMFFDQGASEGKGDGFTAGGGGGGGASDDIDGDGYDGGFNKSPNLGGGGAGGVFGGNNGSDGGPGQGGGGGGGGSNIAKAGNGGRGSLGCGGGGGGATAEGSRNESGAGGDGGDGYVCVWAW